MSPLGWRAFPGAHQLSQLSRQQRLVRLKQKNLDVEYWPREGRGNNLFVVAFYLFEPISETGQIDGCELAEQKNK